MNEEKKASAVVSRNFNVEVILKENAQPFFMVRELFPQGVVVSTFGTYKELCQFFDTIKR